MAKFLALENGKKMTDIVIIILVVFLIILAGISFFLNKKNTISKNDVDFDELSKDLYKEWII